MLLISSNALCALWYLKNLHGSFTFLEISFSVTKVLIGSSSMSTMFSIEMQLFAGEIHKSLYKSIIFYLISKHFAKNFVQKTNIFLRSEGLPTQKEIKKKLEV